MKMYLDAATATFPKGYRFVLNIKIFMGFDSSRAFCYGCLRTKGTGAKAWQRSKAH
jgi:hypothetical protein